jgi:hypothetical protein
MPLGRGRSSSISTLNAHSVVEHHEHEYTSSQGKRDPTVQSFITVNQAMAAAMKRAIEDWPTILEDWRSR